MSDIPPKLDGPLWEDFIERRIREARDEGAFAGLAGAGRPLPGIDEPYDELWWVKQKLRDEKASYLPPALALRAEVERVLAGLERQASEAEVRRVLADLNARIAAVNSTLVEGPASTVAPVDVARAVERWRRRPLT